MSAQLGLQGDTKRRNPGSTRARGGFEAGDGGVGERGQAESIPLAASSSSLPSSPSSSLWLSKMICCCSWERRPTEESDYEVLIHGHESMRLSDPRLRPRFPTWLVLTLVLLFLAGLLCVYFLVPRGVGFGSAQVNVDVINLNRTLSSYQLVVKVELPIYNNNYVDAYLSGNVTMLFYKAQAGSSVINGTRIPRRKKNEIITATVNASFVPFKYIETVLDHCITFPHQLVFFVDGTFEGRYLGQKQIFSLDTYTFIQCPDWG